MYQQDEIIAKLGIQDMPEEKQQEIVQMATFKIGEAVTSKLSEQEFNEYEAIVNDDQAVITAWLEQNVPEYKQNPVYQEMEAGYEDDPERNSPAKLFATLAWIEAHVPNIQEVIESTLEAYKQELATS